jgi:hypothetical protein
MSNLKVGDRQAVAVHVAHQYKPVFASYGRALQLMLCLCRTDWQVNGRWSSSAEMMWLCTVSASLLEKGFVTAQ